jgi:hypothetical protein
VSAPEIHELYLVLLIDEVDLTSWQLSGRPHFVNAKVQVFSAQNPHKHNIVLRIIAVFGRFSFKHSIELFIVQMAWCVEG